MGQCVLLLLKSGGGGYVSFKINGIAQNVSCQSVIAETWFRSQANLSGFCREQIGTITSFYQSISVFSFQYHSINSPHY
jgi:hypothetical protein